MMDAKHDDQQRSRREKLEEWRAAKNNSQKNSSKTARTTPASGRSTKANWGSAVGGNKENTALSAPRSINNSESGAKPQRSVLGVSDYTTRNTTRPKVIIFKKDDVGKQATPRAQPSSKQKPTIISPPSALTFARDNKLNKPPVKLLKK